MGLVFRKTSRIKIYWSIGKTTDHSYHFQIVFFFRSSGSISCFSFREFSTKQNILFSYRSNLSHFIFILPCLLVRAGVSDSVLISLSSDNNFPPKKEYSEPWTCLDLDFQHTLAHVLIHQRKIHHLPNEITKAAMLYATVHFVSNRTQTSIQQENV